MDWDLEAIVRGCCNNDGSSSISDHFDNSPFGGFGSFGFHQDHVFLNFPDICETTTILDELEQLYKPFYPAAHTILSSTTSISVPTAEGTKVRKPPKRQQQPLLPPPPPLSVNSTNHGGGEDADRVAKLKKGRKNQQKKVVQQATADGLSSDMWAWRKYGQKPIKGSPYPRSYYRCSSSKGCPARKQVERSGSDPGLFIISYGGEHNHTHPTKRSSLAGSTRNRSSVITRRSVTNESTEQTVLSPIESPPPVTSTGDELAKGEENENLLMPDLIFNDEYFPSLEDLEGGSLLYQFPEDCPEKSRFINESATLDGS